MFPGLKFYITLSGLDLLQSCIVLTWSLSLRLVRRCVEYCKQVFVFSRTHGFCWQRLRLLLEVGGD